MIDYSYVIETLGLTPRLEQELTYDALNESLGDIGQVSLFQVDTGVGKSLGISLAALSALVNPKPVQVVIATTTVTLAKEIQMLLQKVCNAIPEFQGTTLGLLVGAAHYVSPSRLEDAVALIKEQSSEDLKLLNHLTQWQQTIDEFIAEYGQLPFLLDPKDICQTLNDKAEIWQEIKDGERLAEVVVTTHSMIAIDMRKRTSLFKEDCESYLIIDEADQFVDLLKSLSYCRLNLKRLCSEFYNELSPKTIKAFEFAIDRCELSASSKEFNYSCEAREDAIELLDILIYAVESDKKSETLLLPLLEYLQYWKQQNITSPNLGTGVSLKLKEPAIVALSPYSSRAFGQYALENYKSAALLSGTLSVNENVNEGVKWCIKDLGLSSTIGRIFEFSPKKFGSIEISLCNTTKNEIYLHKKEGLLNPLWVAEKSINIAEAATGRSLVLTSSHKESKVFFEHFQDSAVLHKQGDKISVALEQFRLDKTKKYLFTAAGHTGLNLKDSDGNLMISDIFITRLGFPPPNENLKAICALYKDDRYRAIQRTEHFAGMVAVTRKIKQSLGRGIRAESDEIHFCILDHRFPSANDFGLYKILKNGIPKRFFKEYVNANFISDGQAQQRQEIVI